LDEFRIPFSSPREWFAFFPTLGGFGSVLKKGGKTFSKPKDFWGIRIPKKV